MEHQPRKSRHAESSPRLDIIIVSYNAREDLERCLKSLHDPPPRVAHTIVVVDNASSDGSAEAARAWDDVRVVETGRNLGFAAGTNAGIRLTCGSLILLLNSDTIVPAGAIDRLVSEIGSDERVVALGPRLVDAAGRTEISFGRMIGPLSEVRQKALGHAYDRGWRWAVRHVEKRTREPHEPDWVSGACLLVRREAAEAAGLLDERYFLYAEDVDFCAALRARGGRIRFTPAVEVVHARGRSRRSNPGAANTAYRRSHLAFYEKHHPRWAPLLRMYLWVKGELGGL